MKSSFFGLSVLATVLILGATPALAQQALNGPMENPTQQPLPSAGPAQASYTPAPAAAPEETPNPEILNTGPETMGGTGQEAIAGTGTDATLDVLPENGVDRGLTVAQRSHPEYVPQGVRVGSFRFLPEISFDELYNDNIYATHHHTTGDWTNVVAPQAALRSDWRRNELNFLAADTEGFYDDHTDENYSDYLLQTDGRIDVTRDTKLAGLASYGQNHEDRSNPNDASDVGVQKKPTVFQTGTLQGEVFQKFDRIKLDAIYTNQKFTYNDGNFQNTSIIDGTTYLANQSYLNSDRNRDDNDVMGRVSYELTPTEDVYVQSSYNNRQYDHADFLDHVYRNSDGWNVYGGLRADVTGKLFGDIYAGYMEQNYKSSYYKDFSGVGFGLDGFWNVTTLDTITLNVGRDVEETIVPGSSSYIETRVHLNWDHELLRNLLLTTEAGYDYDDFQGISRHDDVYLAGGGLKYLINSHFNVYANYDFVDRDSNDDIDSYKENRFLVGIKAAL
jgi:hypothetical protein